MRYIYHMLRLLSPHKATAFYFEATVYEEKCGINTLHSLPRPTFQQLPFISSRTGEKRDEILQRLLLEHNDVSIDLLVFEEFKRVHNFPRKGNVRTRWFPA
jgi:hypothetical protein